MKKKSSRSAEEFAAALAQDAEYQAKRSAQELHAEAVAAEEALVLADLRAACVPVAGLESLVATYEGVPEEAVGVLLHWLPRVSVPSLQAVIVRQLAGVGKPFDVQVLLDLFERTTSESLRWAVANTLAELQPLEIRTWLLDAVQNPAYGKAREMLALAVARTSPASDANSVLLALMEEMPGHAALALAESGTAEELRVLEARLASAKGWVKKEIERAIRTISRRLQK